MSYPSAVLCEHVDSSVGTATERPKVEVRFLSVSVSASSPTLGPTPTRIEWVAISTVARVWI